MKINYFKPLSKIAFAVLTLASSSAFAQDRYVSPSGMDNTNCSDLANPCATIQYAADQALAFDNINLAPGIYNLMQPVLVNKSLNIIGPQAGINAINRNPSNALQIANEATLRATAEAFILSNQLDNVTFDGLTITPANNSNVSPLISTLRNDNISIKNIVFGATNAARLHGGVFVNFFNCDNSLVENCWFLTMQSSGRALVYSSGKDNVVNANRFRISDADFIYAQGTENHIFSGNVSDRAKVGIRLGSINNPLTATFSPVISGNTINSTSQAIVINNAASVNVKAMNNVLRTSGTTGLLPIVQIAALTNVTGTMFNDNRFSSETAGNLYAQYSGVDPVDFTCNFWSTFEAANFTPRVSGNVTVFPYRNIGTSVGAIGFYPTTGCTGVDPNIIKEAVNNVANSTSSLNIFPNPATNYAVVNLTVANEGIYNLTILDLAGRTIRTQNVNVESVETTLNLDLAGINSGVYFVKISGNNTNLVEKVIVQK